MSSVPPMGAVVSRILNHNTVDSESDHEESLHVFVSARFDGGEKEQKALDFYSELKKNLKVSGIKTSMVETAGAGCSTGLQPKQHLNRMWLLLPVCFEDYGAPNDSTFHELRYAVDHRDQIQIAPLKLCKTWPPVPPAEADREGKGAAQLQYAFKQDLLYSEWSDKEWNAAVAAQQMADNICKLRKFRVSHCSKSPHQQLLSKKEPHVLVSARFDGGEKECKARELNAELKKHGIKTYMVETVGAGDDFGEKTMTGLAGMSLLLAVCFENYGEKTKSPYCTYYEVKYALDNKIPIAAIKLCKEWPPAPRDCEAGAAQLKFAFNPGNVIVKDWYGKHWNAAGAAKEMADAIGKLQENPTQLQAACKRFSVVFSIRPPPMDTNDQITLARTKNRLAELCTLLKEDDVYKQLTLGAVCLTDASAETFESIKELKLLVWSDLGCIWSDPGSCGEPCGGWERYSRLSNQLSFEDLIQWLNAMPDPPQAVVVCCKYGSEAAAHKLERETKVRMAVWLRGSVLDSVDIFEFLITQLVTPLLESTGPAMNTAARWHKLSPQWGIVCRGRTEIVLRAPAMPDTNIDSVLMGDEPEVFDILASDVMHATCIRERLEVGDATRFWVLPAKRGRAVAMEVCKALLASTAYASVRRVSSLEDAMLARSVRERNLKVRPSCASKEKRLIWFDYAASSERQLVAEEAQLEGVMCELAKDEATHMLFTTAATGDLQDEQVTRLHKFERLLCLDTYDAGEDPREVMYASTHHDEVRLVARKGGQAVRISDVCGVSELCSALEAALVKLGDDSEKAEESIVTALYVDDDGSCFARFCVRSAIFLHQLRDYVLGGDFDNWLMATLSKQARDSDFSVSVDRSSLAEAYARALIHLEKLTPHQKEALCRPAPDSSLHIIAPAGAGKTFVGLHLTLEHLQSKDGCVLFVARNPALCLFYAKWLCCRTGIDGALAKTGAMRRMWFLSYPFEEPHQLDLVEGCRLAKRLGDRGVSQHSSPGPFALAVVDEAHHVFSDPALAARVEHRLTGNTRRVLLSDISQQVDEATFPQGLEKVELREVIRSSQRIVAASAAFQLSRREDTLVTGCPPGPPLQSYLFELQSGDDVFSTYADHTFAALADVVKHYPTLSLDDRVAIVVPDDSFCAGLRLPLAEKLKDFGPEGFQLVSALEAASILALPSRTASSFRARLVISTISDFDGLERLIVIAVGLDSPRQELTGRTRSCLYRAITRAQMFCAVVNAREPDGMLAYLTRIQLSRTHSFKHDTEMEKYDADAAERLQKQSADNNVSSADMEAATIDDKEPPQSAVSQDGKVEAAHVGSGVTQQPPTRISQSIWDTSKNTAAPIEGVLRFQPIMDGGQGGAAGAEEWAVVDAAEKWKSVGEMQVTNKGNCIVCNQPVTSLHAREKQPDGSYRHHPDAMGQCILTPALPVQMQPPMDHGAQLHNVGLMEPKPAMSRNMAVANHTAGMVPKPLDGKGIGATVFISLRYCEADREAKILQNELGLRGIKAFICEPENGERNVKQICQMLRVCSLYIIMASKTYGCDTGSPCATDFELESIMDMEKRRQRPVCVVRMIPFGEFQDDVTSMYVSRSKPQTLWLENHPLPDGLVDSIVSRHEQMMERYRKGAAPL